MQKECQQCGERYNSSHKESKYCSLKCTGLSQRRPLLIPQSVEDFAYFSRTIDKKSGYVRVRFPTHPCANTWGFVYEHRLMMEQIMGRYLLPTEHVHHKNGVRWDNRPENLQMLSHSDHAKIPKGQIDYQQAVMTTKHLDLLLLLNKRERKKTSKICEHCQKVYLAAKTNQKFCSTKCQKKVWNKKYWLSVCEKTP